MRSYGANVRQRSARAADKVVLDWQNGLGDNLQGTFQKQIEDANHRAGQTIFDGDKQRVSSRIFYSRKRGIERCSRNGRNGITEKLKGGRFAEGARLTLKCYARFLEYHVPAVSRSPNWRGGAAASL